MALRQEKIKYESKPFHYPYGSLDATCAFGAQIKFHITRY